MPLLRLLSRGLWPAAPVLLPMLLFSLLPAIPLSLAPGTRYANGARGVSGITRAADVSGFDNEASFGGDAPEGEEGGAEDGSELTVEEEGPEAVAWAEVENEDAELEEGAGAGAGTLTQGYGARPTAGGAALVKLSDLRLTHSSAAALEHPAVRASEIRFAFALSAGAKVRARLAKDLAHGARAHWHALADSVTLAGVRGHNRARLRASSVLPAGVYRLTLTPLRGPGRSLVIRVK